MTTYSIYSQNEGAASNGSATQKHVDLSAEVQSMRFQIQQLVSQFSSLQGSHSILAAQTYLGTIKATSNPAKWGPAESMWLEFLTVNPSWTRLSNLSSTTEYKVKFGKEGASIADATEAWKALYNHVVDGLYKGSYHWENAGVSADAGKAKSEGTEVVEVVEGTDAAQMGVNVEASA